MHLPRLPWPPTKFLFYRSLSGCGIQQRAEAKADLERNCVFEHPLSFSLTEMSRSQETLSECGKDGFVLLPSGTELQGPVAK
jgi:hypothetical protein